MRRLRVGIVGAGIGAEHFQAYLALTDRFEVRYMCDLDDARAAQAVSGRKAVTITRNLDQILADPEIDLVDICLPPHLHLSACSAALQAGKDVICEKPLVASLAEADQLADMMQQTGEKGFSCISISLWGRGGKAAKADGRRSCRNAACWQS